MSTIVTRAGKGSPLTHNEVDANFTNLNTDKYEAGATFNSAVRAQTEAALIAGANVTITPAGSGATRTLTIAASGGGGGITALTGDVTASGTGSVAATIAAGAVTVSKMANMAASTILGNNTGSPAAPVALTVAQVKTLLAYTPADIGAATAAQANATHTGDATGATALTLATVNANVGAFGSATQVATFTVNAKGLTTAAGNTTISIPMTAISDSTAAGRAVLGAASATAQTALFDLFTSAAKGLAPASGGGTTNFLRADGTWAAPPGGGGGSPGGSSGEIQFNDAGAFAGAANVEIEGGNLKLMTTTDPAAPTGGIALYAANFAGRLLPKIIGPTGIDTALQAGLHGNSVILISPTSGTAAPSIIGGTLSTAATMSLQFTAGSTNRWYSTQRKRFQTSTTAGNASGMRLAYAHVHRGNAAGFGGFFFRAQLGCQINLNGGQKFVGLAASTGALAGEPSALLNMCGMGYDAVDSSAGNWQFMRNDGAGAAVKVDLGADAARGTTQGWDLIMFMRPNSAELFVRIVNLNTNALVLDTSYTTDVPAANAGMNFKAEVRNGAVAAADNLEVSKVYIEKDY